MSNLSYEKLYIEEPINVGDVIQLEPKTNKVTRAFNKRHHNIKVIGVCIKIENNTIVVANKGMVDVNVTGLFCIGDKLTSSDIPGKARAIRYKQDETQFNIRSIGKVIELYRTPYITRVLLDVE